VPDYLALNFGLHPNVVGPSCGQHEEHLIPLRFGNLPDLIAPTISVPGMFF
jgi:hypothetical protein